MGFTGLVRKESVFTCECKISEDIMVVRLEYTRKGKKDLYVCACCMTVEGQERKVENRRKYETLKHFIRHVNERALVVDDINEHIVI